MLTLALMIPFMVLGVAVAVVPLIVAMLREDKERRAALAAGHAPVDFAQRDAYPEAA